MTAENMRRAKSFFEDVTANGPAAASATQAASGLKGGKNKGGEAPTLTLTITLTLTLTLTRTLTLTLTRNPRRGDVEDLQRLQGSRAIGRGSRRERCDLSLVE